MHKLWNPLLNFATQRPQRRAAGEALIIFALTIAAFVVAKKFDLLDSTFTDNVFACLVAAAIATMAYGLRRIQHLKREIERRRLAEPDVAEQAHRLATALENMTQGLIMFDPDERIAFLNNQYLQLYGLSPDIIKPGLTFLDLLKYRVATGLLDRDPVEYRHEIVSQLKLGRTLSRVIGTTDGRHVSITNRPLENGGWVTTHEDITEKINAEARIAHMAHHDDLTGLPNRTAFNGHMAAALAHAAERNGTFAVLCFDLDRFKEVNDLFGHTVGDALLREVAKQLERVAGEAFMARLGGDEFIVISTGGPQPATAEALANRFIDALATDIEIEEHLLQAGLTIGVAVYPNDGKDAATLIANADAALYRAKREARGSVRVYDPSMGERLREKRLLQHDLRLAVTRNEVMLNYQPQALIDGKIIGFEALARWHHPVHGWVPPGRFIPLAEESGLIISLGEWILREGCREAASWPQPLHIAINLSPIQFRQGDLVRLVHSVLLETGLAPGRLELEITEGVLINDPSRALSILRRLKNLGVRVAMDDFGTGYSSLSYLQSFPFDKIKVDQGFIKNVTKAPQSAAIVRAVLGLGLGLGVPVIAEGVETEEQLAFLRQANCNQVQGYLIGRPKPIESYAKIVGRTPAPAALRQAKAV